ncbi:outer membrane protein assembly factor [Muribaculaceae bacterium Isolate-039 (Harlan)]|uniref:translocation and assembly module lipoprotein TamL n=3 Tax=Muribaculaceae TaxID=2005473 RepID=UPI000F4A6696|nr:outer membrane protein assembly factor [Muribaculaceae bacterium S4]NBI20225.1 outer membrane protein assembly factor [Muribaculaceae bacterium Z1]QCD40754.1 outer membrane protein assembly factor [Duncaniella sp. C9]QCP73806.1 outer membrane protein assembly factor [Duncaniella sp. B8]ROS91542.1 outer membrane protein assembly factor [Muribaculaceae bacterium Isolate-039 (Harlan)]ROS95264.1 outer membrane protein assembly factor [Muribaculaceae bacterium Isolate-077 (Janvier)]ROS98314.1 o
MTIVSLCALITLWSCSATRHVPRGKYMLDDVSIEISGDKSVSSHDLINYLKQSPNHEVLGFWKLQLGTYNLSGKDSTKWYNRWVRRMGQAPVIYSQSLTDASVRQLRLALVNRGYLEAEVTADTMMMPAEKKIKVAYKINTGEPRRIAIIRHEIPDSAVRKLILADSAQFSIHPGDRFDRDNLDSERALITQRLREHGYYSFNKEYITFYADTSEFNKDVDLTLTVRAPRNSANKPQPADSTTNHNIYYINKVYFVTSNSGYNSSSDIAGDTVVYKDITVIYGKDHYLKPGILQQKCFITPGSLYRASDVDRTYEALARLGILKSINIELVPTGSENGRHELDAYILLARSKKQSVTFDVEGTNSEGDFGFGLGATYQHRNLAKGSQLLTARLRMNYESLSGKFNGLINDRYTEYAGEIGITFPKFEFPFASQSVKHKLNVDTEFALSFNYQERPEYTRIIAGAAWKYKWVNRNNTRRHNFDLIDINYVYLPESTLDFLDQIAPDNPLLRYSYEDHFIMSMAYRYYYTNKRIPSSLLRKYTLQPRVYTLRASVETAGNLLYAISSLSNARKDNGSYNVFGINYSQYVKGEVDYAITRNFNQRHSLAFHAGAGIGVPYGNSTVLPFEKRFYAGGANGVRGWGVRTLGPGSYDSRNSVTDFINQCGDIRLDLSLEYRSKLFWVIEGGVFVDAGNIWTIRNYENQPGGMFHLDTFWKQIAAAYGLGLRFDFTYFLLRLDLGMKAHNPATGQERWPIVHPNWHRDATFHFAVGYPF